MKKVQSNTQNVNHIGNSTISYYLLSYSLTLSFYLLSFNLSAQSQDENYIKVTEALVPTTGSLESLSTNDKKQAVTYFDGLGREKQAVQSNATPTGKSIIVHYEYDEFGRQVKEYLPAPTTINTLDIFPDAENLTSSYYQSQYSTNVTYSEKQLEASPLSRLEKQAAPGDAWAMGSGHEIKFKYDTNASGEVRNYKAITTWNSTNKVYEISLTLDGYYDSGQLYKTTTADENSDTNGNGGGRIEEFKDKEGRVVLKRTYEGTAQYNTYYVYDKYGNLTYVLPPKLSDFSSISSSLLSDLGYQYKYDSRNRLVEKKLPGKGWEYMVYDLQDRLVATQDANLEAQDQWLFTKYDKFGRVVYTGKYSSNSDRATLQTQTDTFGSNNEQRTTSSLSGSKCNYTNNAFPPLQNPGQEIYIVNYYDSYQNIPNMPSVPSSITVGDGHSNQPKTGANGNLQGMHVASIIAKLNVNNQVYRRDITYTMYDDKNRPIRTFTRQHTGGYQFVDIAYNFRGKPLYQKTIQRRVSSASNQYTYEKFTYDAQERLITHEHKVNSNNWETLSHNTYDDLGQLEIKKVGGTTAQALQSVDYQYNIRGWLTDINDVATLNDTGSFGGKDLFTFHINYNQGLGSYFNGVPSNFPSDVQALYNGNISEIRWRTHKDNILRGYEYAYDDLNRLQNSIFVMPQATNPIRNSFNEKIEYDKNGNITHLYRTGQDNAIAIDPASNSAYGMDQLTYTYDDGNQLLKVSDDSNNSLGFNDDSTGLLNDTSNDYTYDANGNMTEDENKEISLIEYNHLNLPTRITWANNNKIEYLYDATGVKLQKKVTEGTQIATTDYQGGYQYLQKTASEPAELQFFPTAEGYVKATVLGFSSPTQPVYEYDYVYNYTDHLGNIRLSYTQDPENNNQIKILEENNYYPFGLKHGAYNISRKGFSSTLISNVIIKPTLEMDYHYKYQGQERQTELNLNWDSFKWRNYDYAIGRFMSVDPLSEKYSYQSHYNFAENRVVDGNELEGLEWVDADGNLIYDPKANDGKGVYTEHATNNDQRLGNALRNSGDTGATKFSTLVNSDHPIEVNLDLKNTNVVKEVDGIKIPGKIGSTVSTVDKSVDFGTGEVTDVIVKKSVITLSVPTAELLNTSIKDGIITASDSEYQGLISSGNIGPIDIIIAALGHEIDHTLKDNIIISENGGDSESGPHGTGKQILKEIDESK